MAIEKPMSEGVKPQPDLENTLKPPPRESSTRRPLPLFLKLMISIYIIIYCVYYSVFALLDLKATSEEERPHEKPRHLFGKAAEKAFLSIPNAEGALSASRLFTAEPHVAGTEGDLTTAKTFLRILQDELDIQTTSPDYPLFDAGSPESQRAVRGIPHLKKPYAWIDTYYPVMNTPINSSIQGLDISDNMKVVWEADLSEHSDNMDPDAAKYKDAVPAFHGYSKGGEAVGWSMFVGYCNKEEFDWWVERDVPFDDKIVICKYGGAVRGLKVKAAQEAGALGVIMFSDVYDDGEVTEQNGYKAYPYGPARNPTSFERGSVQFISSYAGDPTTPGYPSYKNSTRTEGTNVPSIPSIPVSYSNALLAMMAPYPYKIKMVNNVDTKVMPIWNTMGVIPGHISNEVVLIGNHRDAWVMGAADPSSGTASIEEVIRGLGHLLKNGWKPLRTIVIASWDAEEYGLIGSTEWGEDFSDWIDEHVVAYFNLDSAVSGSRLYAAGSPLLSHFIRDTALELSHPTDPARSLWDARTDNGPYFNTLRNNTVSEETLAMREMETSATDSVGVVALGSGSDFTVFLQHIGVPCGHGSSFGTAPGDAPYHYHSIFDSQRWQEIYADPGFLRHVAVAKHVGLQTLRLTDSIVLPFNTTHYAFELESYLNKVESIASAQSFEVHFSTLRKSIHSLQDASASLDEEKVKAEENLRHIVEKWKKKHRKLKHKIRKIICRIKRKLGKKCHRHGHHREMDVDTSSPSFSPELGYQASFQQLPGWNKEKKETELADIAYGLAMQAGYDGPRFTFDSSSDSASDDGLYHPEFPIVEFIKAVKRIQIVNKKLSSFERGFISKDGIKDREWFKHLGVAPGKWLGYGATTFPGLTEALTIEKNATLAQREAERLEMLIDRLADKIRVGK